jgi:hypothetical protein
MDGLMMKYFVLKPRGDDVFATASRAAMRAYANIILEANPTFAGELREWADREGAAAHDRRVSIAT